MTFNFKTGERIMIDNNRVNHHPGENRTQIDGGSTLERRVTLNGSLERLAGIMSALAGANSLAESLADVMCGYEPEKPSSECGPVATPSGFIDRLDMLLDELQKCVDFNEIQLRRVLTKLS